MYHSIIFLEINFKSLKGEIFILFNLVNKFVVYFTKCIDAKNSIIPAGEIVNILWPDSVTYRAEVNGHWYEALYQVSGN